MTPIRVVEIVGNGEGGGTKCLARIIRHLPPSQFAFTVVAPEAAWLAEVCAQHGADYHPLPLLDKRIDTRRMAELTAILQAAQPDIVNGHGTRAAWFASHVLRRISRRPALIYSEHLFSFDAREGMKRLPWIAIERYICRHADALATSCGANARLAESRGWVRAENIAMRHYGIELEVYRDQAAHPIARQELGIPQDVPLVGTVGRLVPQKGLRYWLDAAALVTHELAAAHLLIVGDGELRAALEQQARQLGLGDRVHFLGAHTAPWRILAACDIVAFSSLFEGLPQTGLEALSAGMPLVATRMNGTEEIIRSGWNGELVPPRDAPSLAAAMLALLRDPAARARMRTVGPRSVEDYHTDVMIARFRATYERLHAQRRVAQPALAPVAQAMPHP
jgi:glycosyltransferase involved in cell wall biosynthesis